MKKLSNTEAKLKKSVVYKKACNTSENVYTFADVLTFIETLLSKEMFFLKNFTPKAVLKLKNF